MIPRSLDNARRIPAGDGEVLLSAALQGRIFAALQGELLHRLDAPLAEHPSESFNNLGGNSLWPAPEGGPFAFNSRSEDFLVQAEDDYRSMLLGGAINLFQPVVGSEVWLSPNVVYEGPFFFHTDRLGADGIIQGGQALFFFLADGVA